MKSITPFAWKVKSSCRPAGGRERLKSAFVNGLTTAGSHIMVTVSPRASVFNGWLVTMLMIPAYHRNHHLLVDLPCQRVRIGAFLLMFCLQ